MYAFVCMCEYVYMCVFAYVCTCVCVCVPCESVCAFVHACVRVVSRARGIFGVCACAYGKGRREGMKNTSGKTCQVFVAALFARNVFHMYIMTIN